MRIYLSGPMRGIPDLNYPAFDAAAERISSLGHEVINPAQMDRDEGFTVHRIINMGEERFAVFDRDYGKVLTMPIFCEGK